MPIVRSTYWFNWVQRDSNWVQRDSTQKTLISENRVFIQTNSQGTFLWILISVSASLASQELLGPFPKSHSPCNIFSANEGGVSASQGILTATLSAGPVHGSPGTLSGCREKGHTHKQRLLPHQGLGTDSDGVVSGRPGGKQGFGFWPGFIYPEVTSPCYLHCHLRVSLFAYQPPP
jgi:hypothetical protein